MTDPLEEMEEAVKRAHPGPLEFHDGCFITTANQGRHVALALYPTGDGPENDAGYREQEANGALIVLAVNNLPALLRVARAARALWAESDKGRDDIAYNSTTLQALSDALSPLSPPARKDEAG